MPTDTQLTPAQRFSSLVARLADETRASMPVSISPEDLARAWDRLVSAYKASAIRDASIYECDPRSVARALVLSALTGLYPDGVQPEVYLIPRRNKGALELNWQPSFRGLRKLARRAGYSIRAVPVFAGDSFSYELGLAPKLQHIPDLAAQRTWETLVAVYVVIREIGEPTIFEVMPKADIAKRRQKSASRGGPWSDWPIEMAMKTAVVYAISRHVTLDAEDDRRWTLREAATAGEDFAEDPPQPASERTSIASLDDRLDELLGTPPIDVEAEEPSSEGSDDDNPPY